MNTDLVLRRGLVLLSGSLVLPSASLGSSTNARFLTIDSNNNVVQLPSSSVLIDVQVTNGSNTFDRAQLLYAPSETELKAKSISISGSGGINVIRSSGADTEDWVVDGTSLVTFASGPYVNRPLSGLLGQLYYQTDLLEAQYLYDGASWSPLQDSNTHVWSEFLGNTYPMNGNSSGSSASHYQDGDAGFSFWRLDTGTGGVGVGSQLRTSQNMNYGGNTGKTIFYAKNVFFNATSNGTDRYIARIGRPTGSDAIGMFFKYSDNINSGFWQCITHNGSTSVTTNTTVAPASTSGSAQTFIIVHDQSGVDTVKFYINNTLVANHSGSIPTVLTNAWFGSLGIEKVTGGSNRSLLVDLVIIKRIS